MQNYENKNGTIFTMAILLFAFSNVFALSGFASNIRYTWFCTWISFFMIFFFLFREKTLELVTGKIIGVLLILLIVIMFFNALLNYSSFLQFTNFLTLFGITFWVKLCKKIDWQHKNLFWLGIWVSLLALLLIYCFLPEKIFSGWNSNSGIGVIPILFFGESCIRYEMHENPQYYKKGWGIFVLINLLAFSMLITLENRSAFITLAIYVVILLFHEIYTKRTAFRIFYLVVIGLNVLFPYAWATMSELSVIKMLFEWIHVIFDKSSLLNGRETLWSTAVQKIGDSGVFGTLGIRTTYYHNFSLDIITQFGWIGWIVYMVLLIAILEKAFRENAVGNLFLATFVCLVFLNSFESVLVCDNVFAVFSYILLGVGWKLNTFDDDTEVLCCEEGRT